jgi:hypothetical protein
VRSRAIAYLSALGACLAADPGRAQEQDAATGLTAEQMIEVERELYRSPDIREPCPEAKPGEIVVCHTDPEEFRVESSTDEALRKGEPVYDGLPRAPDVFGLPPCRAYMFCSRIGRAPKPPLLIDLAALPHALTPEEAAHVFRAEDRPAEPAAPEEASEAEP